MFFAALISESFSLLYSSHFSFKQKDDKKKKIRMQIIAAVRFPNNPPSKEELAASGADPNNQNGINPSGLGQGSQN